MFLPKQTSSEEAGDDSLGTLRRVLTALSCRASFDCTGPHKCLFKATSRDLHSTLPLQVGSEELSRGKPV